MITINRKAFYIFNLICFLCFHKIILYSTLVESKFSSTFVELILNSAWSEIDEFHKMNYF